MRDSSDWRQVGLLIWGLVALGGCGSGTVGMSNNADAASAGSNGGAAGSGGSGAGGDGSGGASSTAGASGGAGDSGAAGGGAAGAMKDASADTTALDAAGGSVGSDAGKADASGAAGASADPCAGALFCEKFDSYAGVTAIADKQKFGPWHAALNAGATMGLDGAHKLSGANALHVHIDNAVTAGGRLFSDGAQPIFATKPTHVYGRMMMYIDPNGTSVHWTFFGVSGNAEPTSPAVGRNASYILSSLPRGGVNTYSFVYGLQAMGTDGYHDCSTQSTTPMPSTWACVSFELDSVARKLRMYKDGATTAIVSVDDHGKGCVAPTLVTSPWYGPSIAQLFVGAWSFHAMNAPLDVWIDDLVVDTKPVACPPP